MTSAGLLVVPVHYTTSRLLSGRFVMSPHSKAISEIKRLLNTIPDDTEIISKIDQLESRCYKGVDANTTRSTVLVAVGLLEYSLSVAIGSFFIDDKTLRRKLFDGDHERDGIIGQFYTRNIVACALNIYGKNTYEDINSIRAIRNLCAHAKSDVDFSSEKLKPLANFHSIRAMNAAWGFITPEMTPQRLLPQSPVHGMLQLLQHLIPYLLLHGSKDWPPHNRNQWRAIFS